MIKFPLPLSESHYSIQRYPQAIPLSGLRRHPEYEFHKLYNHLITTKPLVF